MGGSERQGAGEGKGGGESEMRVRTREREGEDEDDGKEGTWGWEGGNTNQAGNSWNQGCRR